MRARAWMCVLWPSFLMAGLGSSVVFAFIDPLDVAVFGYIRPEREWLYAIGFFLLWGIAGVSSFLTYVMRPDSEGNSESSAADF